MTFKLPICGLLFFSAFISVKADDRDQIEVEDMPRQWTYTPELTAASPTDDKWWRSFDDACLDTLITMGVDRNFDIAMSLKRIQAARAAIGQARAAYFPQLSLSASWNKEQVSAVTTRFHGAHSIDDYFALGVDMNWEIDLFGKVRQSVKAKDAAYKATKAQYDGMMLSIASEVADAYINLRMYQEQLQLMQQHCAEQEKVLKITEARMNTGLGSMLDVAQARVVYYSTQSSIPGIESNIHSSKNALSLLLADYPGALDSLLSVGSAVRHSPSVTQYCDSCNSETIGVFSELLPDYRQIVATGIPAELLRRRPDIIEAETEIAAYAAQLGIAKKDFLPTLSIKGSIGTESYSLGDMFTHDSFSYSIAPTLSWTIFDGLARKYEVTQSRLQMESAIDNYNLTVLTAVTEVDNAMTAYMSDLTQIDRLDSVVDESLRALNLSLDQYTQGLTEFSNVVDAQIDLLQYQSDLITARATALTSLVALYKALGGGWY